MIDFKGKKILITGATGGIGKSLVEKFISLNGTILATGTNTDKLDSLKKEFPNINVLKFDVSEHSKIEEFVENASSQLVGLDILVNNAGITSQGRRDLLEATEESWDLVFDTNLKGPFFISQMVAQQMINQTSSHPNVIINMSSISAYAISENRADYCIAKAGLEVMTKLFASRLAESSILVYELCPGVIESDMTAPVKQKYNILQEQGLSPIQRWGTGEDVATAVEILASGRLTFTTGERLNVDGGFHIRRL